MHAANRVLILLLEDLTESERADIHMANEYHWRAEPGKIAGRPLMDCSNAQPGITPLNTEATKQLGIARYQPVVLPNLREVVTESLLLKISSPFYSFSFLVWLIFIDSDSNSTGSRFGCCSRFIILGALAANTPRGVFRN